MTLLITALAAVVSTVVWYRKAPEDTMKVSTLCFLYWGASLMWMVDAVFEYAESGAAYFAPAPMEMLNDFYLGISVVTLGLVIWLVKLLVQDPQGVVKEVLFKKIKRQG